jgi:hypothetical protein
MFKFIIGLFGELSNLLQILTTRVRFFLSLNVLKTSEEELSECAPSEEELSECALRVSLCENAHQPEYEGNSSFLIGVWSRTSSLIC